MIKHLAVVGLLVASSTSASHAAVVLVDRALPASTHVNNLSSPGRANIGWGNVDGFMNGDSFVSGGWMIESMSVWIVGSAQGFSGFSLFGGVQGTYGNLLPLLSTSFVAVEDHYDTEKAADPCNVEGVGVSYQDGGLGCLPITRVTFTMEPFHVASGDVFDFAIDAVPSSASSCNIYTGTVSGCLFVHATHEALSGVVQAGSDGQYRRFDGFGVLSPVSVDSSLNGWNKTSDINVLVRGTVSGTPPGAVVTPEPQACGMVSMGVIVMVIVSLRKARLSR